MKNKALIILPIMFLTSCGFSTNNLVEGNKYVSSVFTENYYTHWDNELKNAKNGINVTLDDEQYITQYKMLGSIDPIALERCEDANAFGSLYKMNALDDMFNYGYQSKLFDGQMVCGAQNGHPEYAYQLGRVQINSNGFSTRFEKEGNGLRYFATQFKLTTNNTIKSYKVGSEEFATMDSELFHNSTIDLTISLYSKNDANEIINNSFTATIVNDNKRTNNGSQYIFFAFDLEEYNLSRLVGFSYNFTFDDELVNWNKTKGIDIDYSMMLYETFFPYTNWN